MSLPLNAFKSVRPRGAHAAPATAPKKSGAKGPRPPRLHGSGAIDPDKVRVLDVNGKPMATLAPRRYGSPAIISRAQSQAQNDKTRAIVRGGI